MTPIVEYGDNFARQVGKALGDAWFAKWQWAVWLRQTEQILGGLEMKDINAKIDALKDRLTENNLPAISVMPMDAVLLMLDGLKDKPAEPEVKNPEGKRWMFYPCRPDKPPHLEDDVCAQQTPCRPLTRAEAFVEGAEVQIKEEGATITAAITDVRDRGSKQVAIYALRYTRYFDFDELTLVKPA